MRARVGGRVAAHPVVVEEDEVRVEPHDLLHRVGQVLDGDVQQPLLLPQRVVRLARARVRVRVRVRAPLLRRRVLRLARGSRRLTGRSRSHGRPRGDARGRGEDGVCRSGSG